MIRPTILLMLLLASLYAMAQTEEPEASDASPSAEQPATADANEAATNETAEDPFDYEASEQISEDLSVSFPVDI